MRPAVRLLLLALFLVSCATRGIAVEYCIDAATGNDANTGLCPGQSWATLGPSQSFNFASGDRVLIAAGTYVHPQTSWYMLPGVSWIGAGRGITTIVYNRPTVVAFVRFRTGSAGSGPPSNLRPGTFGPSTVFADMTLLNQGLASTGIDLAVTSADSSPTIRSVEIVGFPTGIGLRPSSDERAAASAHAVISNAVIRGSDETGMLFMANVFYARTVTEGSTVTNSAADADINGGFVKTLINDPADSGFAIASPTLTNVTLAGGSGSALLLQSWLDDGISQQPVVTNAGTTAATIRNSILTRSSRYGIEEYSPFTEPAVVDANALGGNTLGDYLDEGATVRGAASVGTGNLPVVAAFVDAAAGDLHVLATSPTIDRLPPATAPATDMDAQARPQQATSDMGADEWFPCTAVADVSRTIQAPPCTGGSSLLDGSLSSVGAACTAGLRYQWWRGPSLIATTPTFAVAPTASTTYRLRVSCADPALSACFAEATVTIEPSTLTPSANAGTAQSACAGVGETIVVPLSGTASAIAPATITSTTWTATAGTFADPSQLATGLSIVGAGTRQDIVATLTAVDSRGCSATSNVAITAWPRPQPAIVSSPSCVDPAATTVDVPLMGSAAGSSVATWTWSSPEGTVTGASNASLTVPAQPAPRDVQVDLEVTDDHGCTGNTQAFVRLLASPVANAGADALTCGPVGGSVDVALDGLGTGASPSYLWTAPEGAIADASAASTRISLGVGAAPRDVVVTLQVTSDGCASTDSRTITVAPPPAANAGADVVACFSPGVATIPLDGSASSGVGTLRFAWSASAGRIASPAAALTSLDIDVTDADQDVVVTLNVTDDATGCASADTLDVHVRALPIAVPGAQYSVVRSGGATTDVPLDGSASTGRAPLAFAWTTTLGTFADTGTTSSALEQPTLVVPDMPVTQRGQACLEVTSADACPSEVACAPVLVLLAPVNPPNDVSPTLRLAKSPPDDVVLSFDDSAVDATHDAATRHEAWVASRACGPFVSLLQVAAQPGALSLSDPILATPPRLRFYFVRSFNDGGASLPPAPDGTACP